jgi:hypothetical protein
MVGHCASSTAADWRLDLPIYNGMKESTTYQIEAPEKEFWNL